jgi:hypothetical protein
MKYNETLGNGFTPWQPSTWPEFSVVDSNFIETVRHIFTQTITEEIDNVIRDAIENNGSLEHRGHVIAIAQLCAIDTISSYALFNAEDALCRQCHRRDSKVNKYNKYIQSFFPKEYQQFSKDIYKLFRNTMIHSWNLFEVGIRPDNSVPVKNDNCLVFGLLNFQAALKRSVEVFLEELKTNQELQKNTLDRYIQLQKTANP